MVGLFVGWLDSDRPPVGTLNVSNIISGKLLWKIHAGHSDAEGGVEGGDGRRIDRNRRIEAQRRQDLVNSQDVGVSNLDYEETDSDAERGVREEQEEEEEEVEEVGLRARMGGSRARESFVCRPAESMIRGMGKMGVAGALDDVTSIFYHEGRNEIYSGNRQGIVHVWSN